MASAYQLGGSPETWVGIALCVFILLLWLDRNSIYLKKRKRDGD